MESSDNCDDGLYHKVLLLLLLAVVRFLQCDQRLYSQIPAEQQPGPHYLHYLHCIYLYYTLTEYLSGHESFSSRPGSWEYTDFIQTVDIFSFITNRLRHEGAPHRGWSFWHGDRGVTAAAAVSLVPNVSLCCCCLNLQCNTITRLLEAGRSVLSDRTVSTVPPLASYWPRRGWICLHTNITTLQHYITMLHHYMRVPGLGVWVSL